MDTRSTSQRPHLGPPHSSLQTHQLRPAGLLLANPNPRLVPRGPSPGAWHHNAGDWRHPSHSARLTLPPGRHPGLSGRRCTFSVGEWPGSSEPLVTFEGPLCQNPWAHAPLAQCPHHGLPSHYLHSCHLGPPGFLGANPNHRSAIERPFPRGLAMQCRGLGTPEPQCQTHPASTPTARPIGAPPLIQTGRTGRML